jgi:hypothetical protein
MRLQRNDHGPFGSNQPPDPIEGLAQERSGPEQGRKLLGSLIATQMPDERAQPGPFPAREHYRPQRSLLARLDPLSPLSL